MPEKANAQEESDDSEDEETDENEDDEENNENEEEDEERGKTNAIDICCGWDERLADGVLTYKIIEDEDEEGDEDDDDESDESEDNEIKTEDDGTAALKNAVENAAREWNAKVTSLKLVEISSTSSENEEGDIEVQFVDGFSGMIAGATVIKYDDEGLINKATIILPKAAFYVEYESETFGVQYSAQKIEEITVHEMGHALGLGHANFGGDLMSQTLGNEHMVSISKCDVTGVLYANQWKLVNNDSEPYNPKEGEVDC